jgi:phosphate-selective porin OprO and OprP
VKFNIEFSPRADGSREHLSVRNDVSVAAGKWRSGLPVACVALTLILSCLSASSAWSDEHIHSSASNVPAASGTNDTASTNAISGPERLEHSTRVVLETNAPPTTSIKTNRPSTFQWEFAWKGWDGLQVQVVQSTSLENPYGLIAPQADPANQRPRLHLEQVKMSGTFGARLEVDGAAFITDGNLTGFDNGIQLRRLLFSAGGDCILILPVSYYFELGYSAGQFTLNKSYIQFSHIDYLGNFRLGQFQAPMGLDVITSSRDLTFMEPSAPITAIAPGSEAGFQMGQPIFQERATWAFGLFAPGAGAQEYGAAAQDYGSAVIRLTGLPIYHPSRKDPATNRLLHLGVSANILYSTTSTLRYQTRPESYLAPYIIDTGDIAANGAATFGGEVAWVNGPLIVQGEGIYSVVQEEDGQNLNFGGFYAFAGWYLTGESRPYNPATGAFQRLIPRNNFSFSGGGWGAWEVACRFSHTDLSDKNVQGGTLNLLMAGLNWYPHSHVKWMFNYGMGHVSGGPNQGDMFIFQTRVGVDF